MLRGLSITYILYCVKYPLIGRAKSCDPQYRIAVLMLYYIYYMSE